MLSDMLCNNLAVLWIRMSEDVLNQIIAVLITRNVNQWNTWSIKAALADSVEVTAEKVDTTNLKAFLNDLGSELIHAIFRSIANDMINSSATVSWSAMLANMLNAPITKLAVSDDVNACEDLFDAWALIRCQ